MQTHIETRLSEWETRSIDGDSEPLPTLAAEGFTGVASVDDRRLFLLNGRAIGPEATSLDAFETPTAVHSAPDPGLSLLYAMAEEGGETTASYYTEETPLTEVHETLTERGFSGYVSLSENVLSGEYYTVYYGGRSMDVAFVGTGERLLTGEEARERAEAEVGIYEVVSVDLTVAQLPEPGEEPPAPAAETDGTREPAEGADASPSDEPADGRRSDVPMPEGREHVTVDPIRDDTADDPTSPVDAVTPADEGEPALAPEPAEESEVSVTDDGIDDAGAEAPDGSEPEEVPTDGPLVEEESVTTASGAEPDADTEGLPEGIDLPERSEAPEDPLAAERDWRGRRRVPSLDPALSAGDGGDPATVPEGRGESETADRHDSGALDGIEPTSSADETDRDPEGTRSGPPDEVPPVDGQSAHALRETLESVRAERDAVAAEAERLRGTVTDLRERLDRAERERSGPEPTQDEGRSIDPETALSGTDLFVRYDSKRGATLPDVHAGEAERDALVENLRLSTHTRFDSEGLSVAGEPFSAFLAGTIEYRFVEWLVGDLLAEIGESETASGIATLTEALSRIDRAELLGSIEIDGGEEEERERFDVVLRDRMGEPLLVADLHEGREPAGVEPMTSLVRSASAVAEAEEALSGAMAVTTSFFDPEALELADEATRSGLLQGGSRESFVRLSRRRGYHLCLVEARDGGFELTLPEL
ncbi:DUF7527 domain-containing protein [Natronorarus salvus]|uniref:DUF7527 domain-containing protein n=1 Tax=Natronorarus salvus TaxID=3117733 RepID=UPI002F26BA04